MSRTMRLVVPTIVGTILLGVPAAAPADPHERLVDSSVVAVAGRTLEVRVRGELPPATAKARIRIRGPKGYSKRVRVRARIVLRRLAPGVYRIRTGEVTGKYARYVPTKDYLRARITGQRGVLFRLRYQRVPLDATQPAPESPPPAGAIADFMDRVNAARAAGVGCGGGTGEPQPRMGYSVELASMARWYLDDVIAGRPTNDLEDYARSGFTGSYLAQSTLSVGPGSDADAALAAALADAFICSYLLRADVDRLGVARSPLSDGSHAWALTFGASTGE